MTVLVAGAGIGGLTLALSLHQAGVPVKVFETSAAIRPLGVGINLLPHAVRELDELGLLPELDRLGIRTAELAYYSKRGQLIWSEPRGAAAGYRWPQFSVHRGQLQMMLLAAAEQRIGRDNIVTGWHLEDWREDMGGITARFVDRKSGAARGDMTGALLVGADGIHSSLRRTLYPDEGPPIWNGAILWRGTARAEPYLTGRSMIMAGHEFQKFVCYPISAPDDDGKATINFIAERKFTADHAWRREDWNRPGDLADFLPQFEDWRFDWLDVPGLIRAAEAVYEYPMVDRDPLPRWSRGRATLLGDAAHAMYPIGSNGASQAILDARVLTREILAHGTTVEALAAYEAERRPATAKIVLANRENGPEQVMQRVEELAPNGFRRIEDVLSPMELEETAAEYKRLAGFDRDGLNTRPSIVPSSIMLGDRGGAMGRSGGWPPPRVKIGLLLDDFGELFRRCHQRNRQAYARAFEKTGRTPLQYAILELVLLNPGISHGALAETLAAAPSVITTAMKPLRRDGLLIEESAKDDGRRSGYRLSPEGDARFGEERLTQTYAEEMLVAPLSKAERDTLKRLLQRLVEEGRDWTDPFAYE